MAQTITRSISIDVAQENRLQPIVAKQYDRASRFLNVQFLDMGTEMTIEQGATIVINAKRSDGQGLSFSGSVNSDGTVRVPITYWMLELDGPVVCDISIITGSSADTMLTSTSFTLEVQAAAVTNADVEENEDYPVLLELIHEVSAFEPELLDIRNGVHGQTFNSAGDAVRASADQLYNMKTGFDGVTYSSPAAMVQGCDGLLNEKISYNIDSKVYTTNNGFITKTGEVSTIAGYSYTGPILVKKGSMIYVKAQGYLTNVAIVSVTDENATSYKPVVISTGSTYKEYTYYVDTDTYIAVSGSSNPSFVIYEKYADALSIKIDDILSDYIIDTLNPSTLNGYITNTGTIGTTSGYLYTEPIFIEKGSVIYVKAQGYSTNVAIISLTDENATSYTPVVISIDSTFRTYSYYMNESGYIAISGYKDPMFVINVVKTYSIIPFVPSKLVNNGVTNLANGWIKSDGSVVSSSDWKHTNLIPVSEGDFITSNLTVPMDSGAFSIAYYNNSKTFIEVVGTKYFPVISAHSGFISINVKVADPVYPNIIIERSSKLLPGTTIQIEDLYINKNQIKNSSPLYGKKINILADSFTADQANANNWARVLSQDTGCYIRNYGIIGTPIGNYDSEAINQNAFNIRYSEMDNDADIVVMFGGLNDSNNLHGYTGSAFAEKLGTIDDASGAYTVYGQIKLLFNNVVEKYPTKTLVFITPPHVPESTYTTHLADIVKAERDVIEWFGGIQLIDLYSGCKGFSINTTQQAYYHEAVSGGYDIHPNTDGHKCMEQIIRGKIETFID